MTPITALGGFPATGEARMNDIDALRARVEVLERHVSALETKIVGLALGLQNGLQNGTQPTPEQIERQRVLSFGDDLAA